jgi:hypothetical protein
MDTCGLSTTPFRTRLFAPLAAAALVGLTCAAASPAQPVEFPNPCTVLAVAHPQSLTAAASATVSPGTVKRYGSGKYEQVSCDETVGTVPVNLSYYMSVGGSGGVRIISRSHPTGFGGTATLTVGTAAASHAPVDFIDFHKGTLYADLSANGAEPAKLTSLGQVVYRLTP